MDGLYALVQSQKNYQRSFDFGSDFFASLHVAKLILFFYFSLTIYFYQLYLQSCATITAFWRNGGCSVSYDSLEVGSNAVLRLNFCAKNPPLRQAANR